MIEKKVFKVSAICGRTPTERAEIMQGVKDVLGRHGILFVYYPPEEGADAVILIGRNEYEKEDQGTDT